MFGYQCPSVGRLPAVAHGQCGDTELEQSIYRVRGPLDVVGPLLATRKGLRPTLLVARRLRWELLRGPFESQWRRRQLEP